MPQLSVILPTYDGARFLPEQIDSILAQTRPDFELIALDDGSSDDTVAILDGYARRDARVRRLPSGGNRGQNRRLLELLAAATGEFVAVADQDDVWDPDRNARLLDAIGGRALACGRSQLIDGAGRDLGLSILEALEVPSEVGPLGALFQPLVSAHAAIVRRSWIDPGAFFGALPFDQALGLEALFSTGLAYVDEAIVRHRIHGGNQMNRDLTTSARKGRLISPYRARTSLALVGSGRLALFQKLDHLGRSWALEPQVRSMFRHLAGSCWNAWFGRRASLKWLEDELHRCLDQYAASPKDLTLFSENVRSLTRAPLSPGNLARAWRRYYAPTRQSETGTK